MALEGKHAAAISLVQQALQLSPRDKGLWIELGYLQKSVKEYDSAIRAYERAIEIDDSSAAAHCGLGMAFESTLQFERAEEEFRRSAELRPRTYAYVLLGDVQAVLGKKQEAEESFRSALALDERNEEALYNLALVLRSARPEEAQLLLEQALEIRPAWSLAYRELGFVFSRMKKWSEATAVLRKAISLDPGDMWSHMYLANACSVQGRLKEAEEEYVEATQVAKDPSSALRFLGDFYYENDRSDEAVDCYRRALEDDPEDWGAMYRLGAALTELGEAEEGREWLRKGRSLAPNPDAPRRFSDLLGES